MSEPSDITMPPACISQVAFVARHGNQCPHCGSEEMDNPADSRDVEGTYIYTKSMCMKCDYEWFDVFRLTGYCDTHLSCKGDDFIEHLRKAIHNQLKLKEQARAALQMWKGIAENMVQETKEMNNMEADVAFWQSLLNNTNDVLIGTSTHPNIIEEEQA